MIHWIIFSSSEFFILSCVFVQCDTNKENSSYAVQFNIFKLAAMCALCLVCAYKLSKFSVFHFFYSFFPSFVSICLVCSNTTDGRKSSALHFTVITIVSRQTLTNKLQTVHPQTQIHIHLNVFNKNVCINKIGAVNMK